MKELNVYFRPTCREEEEQVASGVHEMNIAGVAKGIQTAETEKTRGNQAFANKNRVAAVQHYTNAIDELAHAAAQKPTDAEEKKIKGMLAVCFANRAAAYLLPGEGQDAQKALEDADQAIKQDAEYSKACVLCGLLLGERLTFGPATTARRRLNSCC